MSMYFVFVFLFLFFLFFLGIFYLLLLCARGTHTWNSEQKVLFFLWFHEIFSNLINSDFEFEKSVLSSIQYTKCVCVFFNICIKVGFYSEFGKKRPHAKIGGVEKIEFWKNIFFPLKKTFFYFSSNKTCEEMFCCLQISSIFIV